MNFEKLNSWSSLTLWSVATIYGVAVGIFVQCILLPFILPGLHAGNGLLVGLDSISFHNIAVELMNRMQVMGLSEWELRPQEQGPAGVAALIYFFTVAEPWTLIPLNAGLHGLGFVLVVSIVGRCTSVKKYAVYAGLPFLLFPSSLTWVSQLHKDVFTIPGLFLVLNSYLLTIDWAKCPSYRKLISIGVCGIGGTFLTWCMRPYLLELFQAFSLLFLFGAFLAVVVKGQDICKIRLIVITVLLAALFFIAPKLSNYTPHMKGTTDPKIAIEWDESSNMTGWFDRKLESISKSRKAFLAKYSGATGNLDENVNFNSMMDVISYVPRSFQLVILSPFPTQWFAPASSKATTIMRREASFEMMFCYTFLAFLPLAFWRWRKNVSLWVITSFCGVILIPYGLTVANLGTLYRMRYGPYMLLVALGVVCAFEINRVRNLRNE